MSSRRVITAVMVCATLLVIAGLAILLPMAIGEESDAEVQNSPRIANTGKSQDDYDPYAMCGFDPATSSQPTPEQKECLIAEKERYRREEGAADPGQDKSWPIEIDPVTGQGCNTKEQLLDMLETTWQLDQEYIRLLEEHAEGIPKAQEMRDNYAQSKQNLENMPDGSKSCFEMNGVTAEISESGEIIAKEYVP